MRTVALRRCRRLALSVRRAAFSFAAARRAGDRAAVCRPIVLRWRRPARPGTFRIGRHAPTPLVSWHPHFHLYFGAVAVQHRRSGRVALPTAVLLRDRKRFFSERRESISRSTFLATREWRRETGAAVRTSARSAAIARSQRDASPTRRSAAANASVGLFKRGRPHSTTESFAPFSRARRAGQTRATEAAVEPRRGREHAPADRPARLFRRVAVHHTREAEPPPAHLRRPVPLVWRNSTVGSVGPSAAAERLQPIPMIVSSSPSRPELSAGAPAVEPARARVPVRTADFEPGVLDRIADDVIRRVERRVRIERERRGV